MAQIKMALNMDGLDPAGTELQANNIFMALTNNPNFPGLAPYLPILSTGISDLRSALTAPQYSSVAVKNRVIHVKKVLNAIKGIVELECGNDEEKALSSGFSLKQGPGVRPKAFNAVQGNVSGSVDLVCSYAGSHAAYVWEMTTDIAAASGWMLGKVTNTTSAQISGLSPGTKYWFRVKAIVHDEEQSYTDPHVVHVV